MGRCHSKNRVASISTPNVSLSHSPSVDISKTIQDTHIHVFTKTIVSNIVHCLKKKDYIVDANRTIVGTRQVFNKAEILVNPEYINQKTIPSVVSAINARLEHMGRDYKVVSIRFKHDATAKTYTTEVYASVRYPGDTILLE